MPKQKTYSMVLVGLSCCAVWFLAEEGYKNLERNKSNMLVAQSVIDTASPRLVTDRDLNLINANTPAMQLLELDDDSTNVNLEDFIPEKYLPRHRDGKNANPWHLGGIHDINCEIKTAKGNTHPVHIELTGIESSGNRYYVAIIRRTDILSSSDEIQANEIYERVLEKLGKE